jgi:hypothetical protein
VRVSESARARERALALARARKREREREREKRERERGKGLCRRVIFLPPSLPLYSKRELFKEFKEFLSLSLSPLSSAWKEARQEIDDVLEVTGDVQDVMLHCFHVPVEGLGFRFSSRSGA